MTDRRLAHSLVSAVLFAAAPALSQPVGAQAVGAQGAAASGNAIIALPLQPVVPAGQRTCSARTASGLGYSTLRAANGPKLGATDYALLGYIGYLAADGRVFDQNTAAPMQVDGVIPGFSEGLKLMSRGSVWRFCVPAALGYGAQAAGPIPANSDLVFQVELLDSRTAAEIEAMRSASTRPDPAPAPTPTPTPATPPAR